MQTSLLGRRARGKFRWWSTKDSEWKESKHEGEIVSVYHGNDDWHLLVVDAEQRLRQLTHEIMIEPRDHAGPLR